MPRKSVRSKIAIAVAVVFLVLAGAACSSLLGDANASGGVECRGWNADGELGRATTAAFDPTPAPVQF